MTAWMDLFGIHPLYRRREYAKWIRLLDQLWIKEDSMKRERDSKHARAKAKRGRG